MPDDQPRPRSRAAQRPRKVVVRDADDQRATEKTEEVLSGQARRDGRESRRPADSARPSDTPLDTRTDFNAALRNEAARADRYGRPATVVAVEFFVGDGIEPENMGRIPVDDRHAARQVDRLAGSIAFTLRREARDTDRIARVTPSRFHVLLPETTEADALRYIDRARQACEVWFDGADLSVDLRMEAASSGDGLSLTEALATAVERVSA
jgi:GGDEF domain-containing protein